MLTADLAKKCKGEFAIMKLPLSFSGASLKTACVTSGKSETETYMFLPRRKGGIYMVGLTDLEDGAPSDQPGIPPASEKMAGKLMEASIKILSRP